MNKVQTSIVLAHFIGQTRRMAKGIFDRLELLKDSDFEQTSDAIDGAISELDYALKNVETIIERERKDDGENYASFSEFVKGL